MREIKFRTWNPYLEKMIPWEHLRLHMQVCFNSSLQWMQFTGLKDKNGKDIYEGDLLILNTNRDAVFEVFYHDGDGCFSCARPHYFGSQCGGYVPPLNSKGLEVIGNIYENKELLEA